MFLESIMLCIGPREESYLWDNPLNLGDFVSSTIFGVPFYLIKTSEGL